MMKIVQLRSRTDKCMVDVQYLKDVLAMDVFVVNEKGMLVSTIVD